MGNILILYLRFCFQFFFNIFFFKKLFFSNIPNEHGRSFETFHTSLFFKGSMHRRLGGRIGSPHFFGAHAKYPESGEALAKFSRDYTELYWDFNESIPRPLGGQKYPKMFLF